MRVCSDLLYDFFTLQRDYNKKEGTPSWQEPVPSFQNTSQRKYPNVMIRIFNLFKKLVILLFLCKRTIRIVLRTINR